MVIQIARPIRLLSVEDLFHPVHTTFDRKADNEEITCALYQLRTLFFRRLDQMASKSQSMRYPGDAGK